MISRAMPRANHQGHFFLVHHANISRGSERTGCKKNRQETCNLAPATSHVNPVL